MKATKVPAPRSKRGLHPAGRDAEPQVVELAPQTTEDRRTDTTKTSILRDPKPVEPHELAAVVATLAGRNGGNGH